MTYDFEQAKMPGRTGWVTDAITNSFLSDLLPGFNLSLTHDLWRGTVGTDTASFDPFLQNVSASFAISGNTLRAIGSVFGLGGESEGSAGGRRSFPPTWRSPDGGSGRGASTAPTTCRSRPAGPSRRASTTH